MIIASQIVLCRVVSFVGILYVTFVVKTLWNWFAVPAFNIHPLAFWPTFGLMLLMRTVLTYVADDSEEELRWRSTLISLDACIPVEK